MIEDARSFYFDLALSGSPVIMPALLSFAKPGHILLGSDYPNAPGPFIKQMMKFIDEYDMDEKTRRDIYNGTAIKLFPRLKDKSAAGRVDRHKAWTGLP